MNLLVSGYHVNALTGGAHEADLQCGYCASNQQHVVLGNMHKNRAMVGQQNQQGLQPMEIQMTREEIRHRLYLLLPRAMVQFPI